MAYPLFQPDAYVHNDIQLFRVIRREHRPALPGSLKLYVEDAYEYVLDDDLERVYRKRWLMYTEMVGGKYALARRAPSAAERELLPSVA